MVLYFESLCKKAYCKIWVKSPMSWVVVGTPQPVPPISVFNIPFIYNFMVVTFASNY